MKGSCSAQLVCKSMIWTFFFSKWRQRVAQIHKCCASVRQHGDPEYSSLTAAKWSLSYCLLLRQRGEQERSFRSLVPMWVNKHQARAVRQVPCRSSRALFWQAFSPSSPGFLVCCLCETDWGLPHAVGDGRCVVILLSKKGCMIWSSAGDLIWSAQAAMGSSACRGKGHYWSDAERKYYCGYCGSWNEGLGMGGRVTQKNWWAVNSDPNNSLLAKAKLFWQLWSQS